MSYLDLYNACQELPITVSRGIIRSKIEELLGGGQRIAVVKTDMKVEVCRGMYLAPTNQTRRIVQQLGCHIIVLPREGNNRCWERLVTIKECMHIFDGAEEATDTGAAFERLLAEFSGGVSVANVSPQYRAETRALWRAMGVLCPEQARLQLAAERDAGLTDYQIALRLRIPEVYVKFLFEPWYPAEIAAVLQD